MLSMFILSKILTNKLESGDFLTPACRKDLQGPFCACLRRSYYGETGPIISKFLNFLLFIFLESFDTNSHYPCLKNDTQMVRLKHWIPAALMASRNSAPKIQYIDQHYSSIDSESIFPNFVSVNFKWALFRKLIRHALSMHTQKI